MLEARSANVRQERYPRMRAISWDVGLLIIIVSGLLVVQ